MRSGPVLLVGLHGYDTGRYAAGPVLVGTPVWRACARVRAEHLELCCAGVTLGHEDGRCRYNQGGTLSEVRQSANSTVSLLNP